MTVMQKEDEVVQIPSRNKLSLSLSGREAVSGKDGIVNVLKRDSLIFAKDTVHPNKRKLEACLTHKSNKKLNIDFNMLNGYRSTDGHHRAINDISNDGLPVATLSNMGNTCYLNSVLYTLRFTPTFLHNLHHLVTDLALMHSKLNQTKVKSSSLGRNMTSITGPNNRSSSSKDLLSLGNSQNELYPKTKMQVATEKLHELYVALHCLEMKENNDPHQPASFLQALIDVNSIYHGNQQQDAHELLIYLLDILRETCDSLAKQAEHHIEQQTADSLLENTQTTSNSLNMAKSWGMRRSGKKKEKDCLSKKPDKTKEKNVEVNGMTHNEKPGDTDSNQLKKTLGFNFIFEDFGGVTLRRTKCLECESVTERKEPFYDICVPIPLSESEMERSASELYRYSCVTTENLRDTNKYWCEQCVRYNEASREVSYERLPNLLVLQLKRFSTTANGTEKMNNYMPTPLVLACFCDRCSNLSDDQKLHSYQLYSVIMHLGSTMASGHYIAYTRASDHQHEYMDCCRDNPKCVNFSNSEKTINFLKFLKPRSSNNSDSLKSCLNSTSKNGPVNGTSNCKSMDCCGVKLSKSVIENAINNSARDKSYVENISDDSLWLECDDDVVRTLSTKEFQRLLTSKKNSPVTPYLLFYSRIKDNSVGTNMIE